MNAPEIERAYQEHGWHVYRRSVRILKNEEEARDVCHDVFVKLAESFSSIRDSSKMTAWIYRVATNLCIDRLRVRKVFDSRALEQLHIDENTEKSTAQRDLVLRVLDRFSREEQTLAILRFVDELTLEEMEEISGLTRKTISKRLVRFKTRALKFIRREQATGGTKS